MGVPSIASSSPEIEAPLMIRASMSGTPFAMGAPLATGEPLTIGTPLGMGTSLLVEIPLRI